MKFKVLETEETVLNNYEALEYIAEAVNRLTEEKSLVFSHMVIDGREIHDDPMGYARENLANIEEIEAILKTAEAFVGQYILELYSILFQGIPQVKNMGKLFAVNINDNVWNELDSFIQEMSFLIRVYNATLAYAQILNESFSNIKWKIIEDEFNMFTGAIAALGTYIEKQDTVMIADLVLYEIMPALEKIFSALSEKIITKKEESQ